MAVIWTYAPWPAIQNRHVQSRWISLELIHDKLYIDGERAEIIDFENLGGRRGAKVV